MTTGKEQDDVKAKWESGALLNLTELAILFHVGRDYVKAMVAAGFKTFGGRTTREDALEWLRKNPDFKTEPKKKVVK
jgi:hypothetical protein